MLDPRIQALATTAGTLIGDGHLTADTIEVVENLGRRLGRPVRCLVEWTHVTLLDGDDDPLVTVPIQPESINMARVSATLHALDELPATGAVDVAEIAALNERLGRAAAAGASPTWLFVVACVTGASALGFIFGVTSPSAYLVIAMAAALGGGLRRFLGARGVATGGQAFGAALVTGVAGGVAVKLGVASEAGLLSICPAMVLVPGPHLINGALDVTARHLGIGWHRLVYGTAILLAISGGLVVGLAVVGSDLPATAPGATVPLVGDALAAAVAAGSYPVYFSMPLRQVIWPIVVGGIAHALRWMLLVPLGVGAIGADFVACLVVGLVLEPASHRKHLSFAGVGFAAVVALVPGMYVFRGVSGIFDLSAHATVETAVGVAQDLATAGLLLTAITLGLVCAHDLTRRTRKEMIR